MKYIFSLMIFFAICVVYKFVSNFVLFKKANKLLNLYLGYISDDNPPLDLVQIKTEMKYVVEKSDITNRHIPISYAIGNQQICNYSVDIIDAFPRKDRNFVVNTVFILEEAIGCFKFRMKQAINPFYWFELIIFAPKHLIKYIGVKDFNSYSIKVLNLILTFAWWLICGLITYFKSDIFNAVKLFMQKLCQ